MTNDKNEILKDLKTAVTNRVKDNLVDIVLFGSQLTDDKIDSDFDILIIVKNKTDWKLEREISDVCFDIDLKYGILIDTHVLSRDDLNSPRGKQPIFKNAIKQGYHA